MVARKPIATEPSPKIERPSRAPKRAKTAHVKDESEQESEVYNQSLLSEEQSMRRNPARSLEPEENSPVTESALKPNNRKRKAPATANKDERTETEENKVELPKEEIQEDGAGSSSKKPTRKRKTKEEKDSEAMPLAARSTGLRILIGAHVSVAKGEFVVLARTDSLCMCTDM